MTDTYTTLDENVGASGRPITRQPYIGPRTRSRSTGTIYVWNGTHYEPETASTLAPEAAQLIARERTELDRLSDAALQGEQFLDLNSRQRTGSVFRRIPVLNDLLQTNNQSLQRMDNIQNSRVFDYMRGGADGGGISAQAANTPQEQQRLERTGPTIQNTGPANRGIVLNIMVDRDLQRARIDAMEEWARDPRRRSLEGFQQYWTQNSPRIRAQIQRRYELTNGPLNDQATEGGLFRGGRQRPNPKPPWQQRGVPPGAVGRMGIPLAQPPRPPNVPGEAVFDFTTRTWRTP